MVRGLKKKYFSFNNLTIDWIFGYIDDFMVFMKFQRLW